MKKRTTKRIRITIRPLALAVDEIIDACKRARKGLPVASETELNFADAATMLATLSEKRMELLMFLHEHGPSNIRQLAKQLKRDYSNVHGDVKILLDLGLLAVNEDKLVLVPWDELAIELPLAHIA
jgi:predicted transcriptional regulator